MWHPIIVLFIILGTYSSSSLQFYYPPHHQYLYYDIWLYILCFVVVLFCDFF